MHTLSEDELDSRDSYLYPQSIGYLKEWAFLFDIPLDVIDQIKVDAFAEVPGVRAGLVRYQHPLAGDFHFNAMYARPDDESMIERAAIEILACMRASLNLGVIQNARHAIDRQIVAKALVEFKREAQSHV